MFREKPAYYLKVISEQFLSKLLHVDKKLKIIGYDRITGCGKQLHLPKGVL